MSRIVGVVAAVAFLGIVGQVVEATPVVVNHYVPAMPDVLTELVTD